MRYLFPTAAFAFGLVTLAQFTVAEEPREALSTFKDCDLCPEMVVIPAGSFMMGSPDSEPIRGKNEGLQRQVNIAKPFAVGKFEVTFDEWDACVSADGCDDDGLGDRGWGRGRSPAILISWDDAKAYVDWLSENTGQSYRLPSEAEWEYVARAGTTSPFSTGQVITTDQANFNGTYTYNDSSKGAYRKKTTIVGSFPANDFGLHDVHGNVAEWVADCTNDSYHAAPVDGTAWVSDDCINRIYRGGAWKSRPAFLRSAARNRNWPNYQRDSFGLRVARDLKP
jgi:formylglycine-generating enzyme required for sulfatase activity